MLERFVLKGHRVIGILRVTTDSGFLCYPLSYFAWCLATTLHYFICKMLMVFFLCWLFSFYFAIEWSFSIRLSTGTPQSNSTLMYQHQRCYSLPQVTALRNGIWVTGTRNGYPGNCLEGITSQSGIFSGEICAKILKIENRYILSLL